MSYKYKTYLNIIATTAVIAFSIYSALEIILRNKNVFAKLMGLIVLILTLWLAIHRDTYLAFLGPTVFPASLVKDADPLADRDNNIHTSISVDAPDGTKLAYWGALPSTGVQASPQIAYSDYSNAGVALVKDGTAKISFFCPAKYTVPWGKTLDRHIHYRLLKKDGMMSPVNTVFVKCDN